MCVKAACSYEVWKSLLYTYTQGKVSLVPLHYGLVAQCIRHTAFLLVEGPPVYGVLQGILLQILKHFCTPLKTFNVALSWQL